MSYDTGMSSKMKEFELRHCEKKTKLAEKQNIINWCNYIIETYTTKGISQEIKNEIKIDDITEIRQKLDECLLQKEDIKLFKNYIYNLTHCINCMFNPEYPLQIGITPECLGLDNLDKCKSYFQMEACKFARKYEENKISNQINIMSSMKSGNSMLSSMSGADSKKMASSIMMTTSHLSDRIETTEKEKEKLMKDTINAFIGLYNNYYDTQKRKTENTQKQKKLNEHQTEKINKVNKNLKTSIEILLYPTERDKTPKPKKENKSNYDISLENFNKCVNDICKKYNVENINKLIQKTSGTDIGKFARQIQSFQMCCAARETQEMFMENNLGAGIF